MMLPSSCIYPPVQLPPQQSISSIAKQLRNYLVLENDINNQKSYIFIIDVLPHTAALRFGYNEANLISTAPN
jgi:hypothetical protein